MDRRTFLKRMGKVGITAASVGSLEGLINACAPTLKETRQEIENQIWHANPIIPIPQNGCYAGCDLEPRWSDSYQGDSYKEQSTIDRWVKLSGKKPAIHCIGYGFYSASNEDFPIEECKTAITNGVVPMVKYITEPSDYKQVSAGKQDKELKAFAAQARDFKHPFFFIPYPEINFSINWQGKIPWGGQSGKSAQKALQHMHKILSNEGANNAVWTIQYLTNSMKRVYTDPAYFYPGDLIDWIGFTVRSRDSSFVGPMKDILKDDYQWARENHKQKPIMLVELGTQYSTKSANWITQAYKALQADFPAVKAVLHSLRCLQEVGEDCYLHDEGEMALKQALTNKYYIERIPLVR